MTVHVSTAWLGGVGITDSAQRRSGTRLSGITQGSGVGWSDLKHPQDVAIDRLLALGDVPGVSAQDRRFTAARIPDAVDGLHEGDIIRTKGWVHVVALESDGDYHVQVTSSPTSGNHCLVIEMPMAKATFEKSPSFGSSTRSSVHSSQTPCSTT